MGGRLLTLCIVHETLVQICVTNAGAGAVGSTLTEVYDHMLGDRTIMLSGLLQASTCADRHVVLDNGEALGSSNDSLAAETRKA